MTGDVTTLRISGPAGAGAQPPEPSLRTTILAGLVIIALFFGAFTGWSLFANLDSAVVASGTVVVDSHRKTVQHLEGGILRVLHIEEGDRVAAGQLLVELDSTQADASLGQVASQHWAVKARIARLRAEQDGLRTIAFPKLIDDRMVEPVIAEAANAQRRLFAARWRAHDGAIAIIRRRSAQLAEEIAADRSLLGSVEVQRALTEQEIANVQRLFDKGYERLPRLLELKRTAAELTGRKSSIRGRIAKKQQEMGTAELEIAATLDRRLAEVGEKLQESLALEANLRDRIRAAKDVKDRNAIYAPQDGVVVGLRVFTSGGVIAPGQAIMDIVPSDDSLVIEAKVQPDDIDVVRVGLDAQVWLTAYKRSDVPPVTGRVAHVSADQLTDPRTGESFFITRVDVDASTVSALKEITLQPGMPAEVMIVTGERRAMDYFLAPLRDRMRRAFREQ